MASPKRDLPDMYKVDYTRFADIEDPEPPSQQDVEHLEPEHAVNNAYMAEISKDGNADKLRELKVRLAMEAYDRRRPKDEIMHHYVIKDAGDVDAIGEYYQTGEERNSCPIYKNAHGITLTREKQPSSDGSADEQFGCNRGVLS